MKLKVGLVLGAMMIGLIAVRSCYFRPAVYFGNLREAANCIKKLNYTCCSDAAHGQITTGFMVSKEPATSLHATELVKIGLMRPNWKNKIWVTKHPIGEAINIPDNAGTRVWGRVLAYGDAAFLDEIENGLRRWGAFPW